MTYKAVIFDLDGTLLNTIEDLLDSMDVVLAEVGVAGHDVELAKLYVGDGLRNYVLRALPEAMRGVGDTNTDMQTTTAAGMFAVGATWGYRPASELIANSDKILIDRPLELLGLLNG